MRVVAILLAVSAALGFVVAAPPSSNRARQQKGHTVAECNPNGFTIKNFVVFSGSPTEQPRISFEIWNNDKGGHIPQLCTAVLALGVSIRDDTNYYSCELPGSAFKWSTQNILTVFQAMICVGGDETSIWSFAEGTIQTYSYPGVNGGTYTQSIIGVAEIPTFKIQPACSNCS